MYNNGDWVKDNGLTATCTSCGACLTDYEVDSYDDTCDKCEILAQKKADFPQFIEDKISPFMGKFAFDLANLFSQELKQKIKASDVALALENMDFSIFLKIATTPDCLEWACEAMNEKICAYKNALFLESNNG